jgi:hypothetical protein
MNQRNVEALRQLLAAAVLANRAREGDLSFDFLARFLAARGALVPSALTDEELEHLGSELDCYCFPEDRDMAVEALERVAKGEG